ncbi:hypothetical protein ACHHYP_20133 [Achlya hypogyna]|uniref:Acyltransferase n=1 Tax=Achlya hypogyna TaxID=1202772 RepID=A0A1V9ZR19_ACHHY|nr:hypothetical protein ACHHYP_20133 [Achlya hypogyna]
MAATDHAQSALFQAAYTLLYPAIVRFYDWRIEGQEHVPRSGRILFVGYHSIHNHDLFPSAASIYETTGKLPCGLVHRLVMLFLGPMLRRVGCITGSQENAAAAYAAGYNCVCIPGGGEEAMQGFETAYRLIWKSNSGRDRVGFAKLARTVNATIVPYVTRNGEEMFFNLLGFLWNRTGASRAYSRLLELLPQHLRWLGIQIKMYVWWLVWTLLSFPVPVRAGLVFGLPIRRLPDESDRDLAARTKASLQALLDAVNPGGVSYLRAMRQRFEQRSSIQLILRPKDN